MKGGVSEKEVEMEENVKGNYTCILYLKVAGDICNEPDALIRRQFTNATTAGNKGTCF